MWIKKRLVAVLLFVLFLNIFFFHSVGTVAISMVMLALSILVVGLFGTFRPPWKWIQGWILALTAFASLQYLMVDSPIRQTLLILTVIIGLVYGAYTLLRGYIPRGLLESALAFFQMGVSYLFSGISMVANVLTGSAWQASPAKSLMSRKKDYQMRPIMIGFLVGLPVVIWLTSLLSQADPVFGTYVARIVDLDFFREWMSSEAIRKLGIRLILSVFFLILLLPTVFMQHKLSYQSPLLFLKKTNWVKEMVVIVGMVVAVMGLFLVVQAPYVFARVAAETSLSQFGIATYSEYVQKGFDELVKVAFFVFGLSWTILLVMREKKQDSGVRLLTIFQGILGIEFVVFVISIFRRVFLYTEYHGLSLARLYGLAFLIWMVGMAITLALRYLARRGYVFYELGWTVAAVLITVFINMENVVLTHPPTVNGRVDYTYLSRMSADGYRGWIEAYAWAKEVVTNEELLTKKTLTADERRDVYYAGFVIRTVAINYHELLMQYEDEVAVKAYLEKVVTSRHLNRSGLSTTDNSKLLGLVRDERWQDKINVYPYHFYGSEMRVDNFSQDKYPAEFYLYFEGQNRSFKEGIDRFYTFSGIRQNAYTYLKSSISLDDMLLTMDKYRDLRQTISAMRQEDRWVELDLSHETPLLPR